MTPHAFAGPSAVDIYVHLRTTIQAAVDRNPPKLPLLNAEPSSLGDERVDLLPSASETTSARTAARFRLSSTHNTAIVVQWRPTLLLPESASQFVPSSTRPSPPRTLKLSPREVLPLRPGTTAQFLLPDQLQIRSVCPRSYFGLLAQHGIAHTFVFDWPEPDHPFFQEIAGMRQTAVVNIVEELTGHVWELHLKPSKERTNIFGYLCKEEDVKRMIRDRAETFLRIRKLPLVLDLDDTLVRVVGNEPGRYIPEEQAMRVPHRVYTLKDGRRIVTSENVHEFLDWAQRYFEISVCSLGDQSYVDMVVQVLDPSRTTIRGILHSARGEYLYIQSSVKPRRPPKDLVTLYPFCRQGTLEGGGPHGWLPMPIPDPMIVDDNHTTWPGEQQDNIIVVREMRNAPDGVWSVSLFPVVQNVLNNIYQEFFKAADVFNAALMADDPSAVLAAAASGGGDGGQQQQQQPQLPHYHNGSNLFVSERPPSAVSIYKDLLRRDLANRIADS
ncbi:hypothetical protein BJ742DRAFT_786511 [Cladochytrium replicatum]|nr:hypothetical protein BJ742DRAFT_786511 [Cladochytrium replicatum]